MSKKLLNWGTPKHVQEREKKRIPNAGRHPSRKHNGKYCKFLSGPHIFGAYFRGVGKGWMARSDMPTAICTGCGRQQTLWVWGKGSAFYEVAYLTEEEHASFRL